MLDGRPSDEVWYFAYGSNMHEGTFVKRRDIETLERRVGRIKNHRCASILKADRRGKLHRPTYVPMRIKKCGVSYTRSRVETCFA